MGCWSTRGPCSRRRPTTSATLPLGKSPPTLTDHIDLSVGGTLSVGDIGGQAFRHGLQADNLLELQVVTGRGEVVTCSPNHHADLFEAHQLKAALLRARPRRLEVIAHTAMSIGSGAFEGAMVREQATR